MKLLFDENLSPRLISLLSDLYPGLSDVRNCGLGHSDDSTIWEYAKKGDFTIVSKDSDFAELSALLGAPPKVVWLRARNCTTERIAKLLRDALQDIQKFSEEKETTCLILGP